MLGHEHDANDLAPSRNGGLDIVDMPLQGPLDRPKVNPVMVTGDIGPGHCPDTHDMCLPGLTQMLR